MYKEMTTYISPSVFCLDDVQPEAIVHQVIEMICPVCRNNVRMSVTPEYINYKEAFLELEKRHRELRQEHLILKSRMAYYKEMGGPE